MWSPTTNSASARSASWHEAVAGLDEHSPLCADCLAMVADLLDGYRDDPEGAIERARSLAGPLPLER